MSKRKWPLQRDPLLHCPICLLSMLHKAHVNGKLCMAGCFAVKYLRRKTVTLNVIKFKCLMCAICGHYEYTKVRQVSCICCRCLHRFKVTHHTSLKANWNMQQGTWQDTFSVIFWRWNDAHVTICYCRHTFFYYEVVHLHSSRKSNPNL